MTSVADFAYLWDGSQPGWTVHRHEEDHAKLRVRFAATGPTPAELRALRQCVPEFAVLTAADALARTRGKECIELGTFESMEAHQLRKQCAAVGLRISLEGRHIVRLSIINRLTNHFLIIEDGDLSQAVAEEGIRQGLPATFSTV